MGDLAKDSQVGSVITDDIRLTDNVRTEDKKPASLVTQAQTDNVGICEYEPCGKEFERRVSWKRHCSDECRKLNWEAKAGKKLTLKKSNLT